MRTKVFVGGILVCLAVSGLIWLQAGKQEATVTAVPPPERPAPGLPVPGLADGPMHGTVMVQLGTFDSAAAARDELARLRAGTGKLLARLDERLVEVRRPERIYWRLQLYPLRSQLDARALCDVLLEDWDQMCIPVINRN